MASSAYSISASSYIIASKQHCHSHKTQPESRLPQCPRVHHNHHGAGQQPYLWPRPAAPTQLQRSNGRQHQHGALRGHAPATEERIGTRQQNTCHQGRRGGRDGQAQTRRTAPQPPHHQRRQPGKQGDMQTRDAHQMRHAGGAKHIPVGAVNRTLVTRHQGGHHASDPHLPRIPCCSTAGKAGHDGIAHRLARTLDGVPPGAAEPHRRQVVGTGAHIARGLHALLPHPELVVETVGVACPMGGLQAHRHFPALARPQRWGLPQCIGRLRHLQRRIAVPRHIHQRGQCHRSALPKRSLNFQAQAHAHFVHLRHGSDHAGHPQVTPFQPRGQRMGGIGTGTQPAHGKQGQRPRAGRKAHGPRTAPAPLSSQGCMTPPCAAQAADQPGHTSQGQQHAINRPGPKLGLLQLHRGTHQGPQQARRQAPCAPYGTLLVRFRRSRAEYAGGNGRHGHMLNATHGAKMGTSRTRMCNTGALCTGIRALRLRLRPDRSCLPPIRGKP